MSKLSKNSENFFVDHTLKRRGLRRYFQWYKRGSASFCTIKANALFDFFEVFHELGSNELYFYRHNLPTRALAAIANCSPRSIQRAISDVEKSFAAFSAEFLALPPIEEIKSELTSTFAKNVYYTNERQPFILVADG